MSSLSGYTTETEAGAEELPANRTEAGVYATERDAAERGLVALAMGWEYWLEESDGRVRLLVDARAWPVVSEQLAKYERESVGWPPPPAFAQEPAAPAEVLTPVLWGLSLLAAFAVQMARPDWAEAGAMDARAVLLRGEWWRLGTALWLHADIGHVLANALFGAVVFSPWLTATGRVRGWSLLGAAAILGNLGAAALHYPDEYRSIGASTAVFAGLGLLTGPRGRAGVTHRANEGLAVRRWHAWRRVDGAGALWRGRGARGRGGAPDGVLGGDDARGV